VHRMTGVFGPHLDEHVPVLGDVHTASVSFGRKLGSEPSSCWYQARAGS
jgi:hypothetical protein